MSKPKLKFKPMRLMTTDQQIVGDREGAFKCWKKGSLDPQYFGFTTPVLVFPADPESVEALVDLAAKAGTENLWPHTKWDELNEHGKKVQRAMARTHLAALGFKTKTK